MKSGYILILLTGLLFSHCNVDTDAADPSSECLELQKALDEATEQKLDALEAYSKDPSNPVICENYVEALENRIDKAVKLLNSGCLSPGAYAGTELAIGEDQDEVRRLSC